MLHFGLIGRNISYSLSPEIHNRAFREMGVEADYRLYDMTKLPDVKNFRIFMSTLDGANVTIPYKQEVMSLLDDLTVEARCVGAVNTIFKEHGKLKGHNTDFQGFWALFEEAAEKMPEHGTGFMSKKDKVLVLGNGGAAHSVCFALEINNIMFDVLTHHEMDKSAVDPSGYKMVVNATPNHHPRLIYETFNQKQCAIDLTYNPAETEFLREARTRGAVTLNGMTMLIKQAEYARMVWLRH